MTIAKRHNVTARADLTIVRIVCALVVCLSEKWTGLNGFLVVEKDGLWRFVKLMEVERSSFAFKEWEEYGGEDCGLWRCVKMMEER